MWSAGSIDSNSASLALIVAGMASRGCDPYDLAKTGKPELASELCQPASRMRFSTNSRTASDGCSERDRNVTDVSDELAVDTEQRLRRSIGRLGIAMGPRHYRATKGTCSEARPIPSQRHWSRSSRWPSEGILSSASGACSAESEQLPIVPVTHAASNNCMRQMTILA